MTDPYNSRVRELFTETAHAGHIDEAVNVVITDQGVRVELSATVAGDAVQQIRFRAWGCPHTIAACEAVCAEIEGGKASELEVYSASELMQSLAVPAEKSARILVIEDTVRLLGATLRNSGTS